ncbi:MAG: RNA polymerase sigma factor [Nannocystaceae bacterium]|nr:RNA polymerase sigma factor [Nannocystaceae bacterium]
MEQHRAFLEQVVRRVCGEQDAVDVVQDVFVSACRSYGSFRGTATLRTWLYRIAVNRAINAVQARGRRQKLEYDAGCMAAPELPSPFDAAVGADSERRVRNALRAMPEPWRGTVRARVVSGMTLATIAQRDGVSVGTAHRRERLAKARIARLLGLP